MKLDDTREIPISRKKLVKARIKPPIDFAFGEMSLQQSKNGQCVNDITKRTGLKDENFQLAKGAEWIRSSPCTCTGITCPVRDVPPNAQGARRRESWLEQ